jgi:hypothetical protein
MTGPAPATSRSAIYRHWLQLGGCDVQPPNGSLLSQPGLQVTVSQGEPNWQSTSHAQDRPQSTWPHELSPEQRTLQAPVPQVTLAQESVSVQPMVQSPRLQPTAGHDPRPVHATLQVPVPHLAPSHELSPLQVTVQVPVVAQVRLRQLRRPLQVMLQEVLPPQLTLRHELSSEQLTLQLQPRGQATGSLQFAVPLSHSIVQLRWAGSQSVHGKGQLSASMPGTLSGELPSAMPASSEGCTQKPSTQSRPLAQLALVVQAKSLLRRLIEQLTAAPITRPRTGRQRATSFTACLRA